MAVIADRVIVELEAKLDRYDANVRRAQREFERAMGGIGSSAQRTEGLVSRAAGRIGVALAGVSAIALARQFLAMTDEAKKMEAQLRLATAQVGSFGQAQEDVRRIAAATRNDLGSTASLYASFARGARELGINQAQVAEITETVGKAFKVSGTSAADSAGAIRQLSQAFASGVLRGDEFNSIMENAPRLARLLADSLGVPTGALRAMAEQGDLTADKLVKAFSDKEFTAGLQAEFEQIPVTFGDAMTLLYNSALTTFAEFDRGGGFSSMIASFVTDASDGMGDIGDAARETGIEIRSTFAGLSDAFAPLVDAARQAFGMIGDDAMTLADRIRPLLVDIDTILNFRPGAIGGFESWIDQNVWGQGPRSNLAGRFDAGRARSEKLRRDTIAVQGMNDVLGQYDVLGNRIGGSAPPRATGGGGGSKSKPRSRAAPRSPLNPEAFAREEAQLQQEELNLRAAAVQTAEQKAELELQRLAAAQAFDASQVRTDERYTAVQRERLVALQGTVYALQQAAVIADRDKEIAERAAKENEAAQEARRLSARYEIDALQENLRLARTRKQRAEIESRLLDILEEQERVDLENLIASGKIRDANVARGNLAAAQEARRTGAAQDNAGPLERYRDGIARGDEEIAERAEQLIVDEIEHVRGAMRDALSDLIGTDDPLITGLLDLLIEQVIMKPLVDAMSEAVNAGTGGGLGGAIGTFIAGLFGGGKRASGGHVVGGNLYRVTDGEGFRPAGSGQIIPLGRMRGANRGGGIVLQQTVNVDARGVNPDGFAEHIKASVRQETLAIVGQGMKQVSKAVPARMAEFQRDGT